MPPDASNPEPPATPDRASAWLTLGVVTGTMLLFQLGSQVLRNEQWRIAQDAGAEPGSYVFSSTVSAILGYLVAGGAGLAIGGAGAAAGGVALWILGVVAMAADQMLVGVALTTMGRAMAVTGAVAAIARPLRTDAGRLAAFALLSIASNLGFLATTPASLVSDRFGSGAVLGLAGALGLLSLIGAGAALAVQLTRARETVEERAAGLDGAALGRPLTLLLAIAPVYAISNLGTSLQWQAWVQSDHPNLILGWLNPMIGLMAATLLGGAAAALVLARRQVPPLLVGGLGAILLGLGLLPTALDADTFGVGPYLLSELLSGLGEPLLYVGALAAVLRGLPWRTATAFAAALPLASTLIMQVRQILPGEELAGFLATGLGFLVLLGGAAMGGAAFLWRDRAEPPADTPDHQKS